MGARRGDEEVTPMGLLRHTTPVKIQQFDEMLVDRATTFLTTRNHDPHAKLFDLNLASPDDAPAHFSGGCAPSRTLAALSSDPLNVGSAEEVCRTRVIFADRSSRTARAATDTTVARGRNAGISPTRITTMEYSGGHHGTSSRSSHEQPVATISRRASTQSLTLIFISPY